VRYQLQWEMQENLCRTGETGQQTRKAKRGGLLYRRVRNEARDWERKGLWAILRKKGMTE